MLNYVREGDCIYVMDFSRLARSTKDLLDIVELLNKKEVQLISLKENLDSSTPTGKLMLTVIAAIYEFERTNTLERQREGIEIAKREGKYKGGTRKKINEEKFFDLYDDYMHRLITKTEMAKRLRISKPNKIYNDLKGLAENKTAVHKYEFFTDFKATSKVISNAKEKYPDIEIIKFEDTK